MDKESKKIYENASKEAIAELLEDIYEDEKVKTSSKENEALAAFLCKIPKKHKARILQMMIKLSIFIANQEKTID